MSHWNVSQEGEDQAKTKLSRLGSELDRARCQVPTFPRWLNWFTTRKLMLYSD